MPNIRARRPWELCSHSRQRRSWLHVVLRQARVVRVALAAAGHQRVSKPCSKHLSGGWGHLKTRGGSWGARSGGSTGRRGAARLREQLCGGPRGSAVICGAQRGCCHRCRLRYRDLRLSTRLLQFHSSNGSSKCRIVKAIIMSG